MFFDIKKIFIFHLNKIIHGRDCARCGSTA